MKYTVSRSIIIEAKKKHVFSKTRNFKFWSIWSPWLCIDNETKVNVTGRGMQVGDIYSWDGELVGKGEMQHTKIVDEKRIESEVRFEKPFPSTAKISFDFRKVKAGTKVTWNMEGNLPWFLFLMKKKMVAMIGSDYERGLRMLKEYIETGKILADTDIKGIVEYPGAKYVGIKRSCTFDEISICMEQDFEKLHELSKQNKYDIVGAPFSITRNYNFQKRTCSYTAALHIKDIPEPLDEGLISGSIPKCQALRVFHTGDYAHLGNSWTAAYTYQRINHLKPRKDIPPFEVYLNDPRKTDLEDWRTEVFLPVR
jgi:predicted transcriptional regulator YdeE